MLQHRLLKLRQSNRFIWPAFKSGNREIRSSPTISNSLPAPLESPPCPNTKQTWFELFLSETEYRNGPIGLTPLSTVFGDVPVDVEKLR